MDAFDRAQEKKIASGYLLTLDNQIDPTTGTVKFRAFSRMTDSSLFPNQFVNARLLVDTEHGATLVPTACDSAQRSRPVFICGEAGPDGVTSNDHGRYGEWRYNGRSRRAARDSNGRERI